MWLSEILAKDVMIKDVIVINADKKVANARLKMLRHNVGGLPVVDNEGKIVGMITLRDIDLAGNGISDLVVKDLMSTNLVKSTENATLREIVEAMIRTGVQRIPIVKKDGKLVGLVTQTTVIKAAKNLLK
jgi:CBS domain-containing protein